MASILWLPVVFATCSALLYWLSTTLPALPTEGIGVNSTVLRFPSTLEELRDLATLLEHYRANHMGHVVALYSAAYLFKQAFAVPGSIFLNLLGGAIFGQWVGFVLTCFLSASGATCCFLLAKVCGRSYIVKYFPDQLGLIQSKIKQNSDSLFFFLMFLRLFPMTPNWFLNMASPICGVPTHLFFLSVFFGLMPYNFISVQTGSILSQLTSMDKIFTPWTMLKLFTMATAALVPGLCIKKYQEYRIEKKREQTDTKGSVVDTTTTILTTVDTTIATTAVATAPIVAAAMTAATTHPEQAKLETISSDIDVQQHIVVRKDEATSVMSDDFTGTNLRQRKTVKPKVKMTGIAEIPKFSRRKQKESLGGRSQPLCIGVPKPKGIEGDEKSVVPKPKGVGGDGKPIEVFDNIQLLGSSGDTISNVKEPETASHVNGTKEANPQAAIQVPGSAEVPIIVEGTETYNQNLCQSDSIVEETEKTNALQKETPCKVIGVQEVSEQITEEPMLNLSGENEPGEKGAEELGSASVCGVHDSSPSEIDATLEQVLISDEDGWITDEEEEQQEVTQNSAHFSINATKETVAAHEKECSEDKDSSSFYQEKLAAIEIEPMNIAANEDDSAACMKLTMGEMLQCAEDAGLAKDYAHFAEENGENQSNIDGKTTDIQAYHGDVFASEVPARAEDGIKTSEEQEKCVCSAPLEEVADVKEERKVVLVDDVPLPDTMSLQNNENHKLTDIPNPVQHADSTIALGSDVDLVYSNVNVAEGPGAVITETGSTVDETLSSAHDTVVSQEVLTSALAPPEGKAGEVDVTKETKSIQDESGCTKEKDSHMVIDAEQQLQTASQAETLTELNFVEDRFQ